MTEQTTNAATPETTTQTPAESQPVEPVQATPEKPKAKPRKKAVKKAAVSEATSKPVAASKPKKAPKADPKAQNAAKAKPAAKKGHPAKANGTGLRLPQFRLLRVLLPKDGVKPTLTRGKLAIKAGFTAISGTANVALNGRNGDKGLLKLGYVERIEADVDGKAEVLYRATKDGVKAAQAYLNDQGGKVRKVRDRDASINTRYTEKKPAKSSKAGKK